MFGRGPFELVDFAMDKWYDHMKHELDELDLSKIGVNQRLKTGIKTRLSYQIPYIKHWPAAMALGLHPYNVQTTVYKIHKISDHLWYVAGDNSVDYNWYTKRGTLSSVYVATELYMIQDRSKDYKDTWEFLENRLNNVRKAGEASTTAQDIGLAINKGLLSLASVFFPEPSYKESSAEYEKAREKYQKASEDIAKEAGKPVPKEEPPKPAPTGETSKDEPRYTVGQGIKKKEGPKTDQSTMKNPPKEKEEQKLGEKVKESI